MKQLRFPIICILILLLMTPIPPARAESTAEECADRIAFDFGSGRHAELEIGETAYPYLVYEADAALSLTWTESLGNARLCVSWFDPPEGVDVLQYDAAGALLCAETLASVPATVTTLLPDARKAVVQAGEPGMQLFFCRVYGEGVLPDPFHEWIETPDRLDYLLLATHPDDDVLFLGSIVPTYGAERNYVGSIVYVTCQNRVRMHEAENGAWAMGLRFRPVFLGMKDVRNNASEKRKEAFRYEELLVNTVRVYRKLRPLVVFAQDTEGEYGHWQHKLVSKAARDAFALAADPSFDPESAAQYGTWQVQKVFLHLYPENPITVDSHAPLSFFGGRNAYEVACEAFQKHETQQTGRYEVHRDDETDAFNRFGMAEGVVPVGEDVFDRIDETLFCGYVPPAPASAAEATPEPAKETTAQPAGQATPAPTEKPAPKPSETPEPPAQKPQTQKPDPTPFIWIGAVTVLTAAAVGVAAYFWKKRQNGKQTSDGE